jgi:arylsulfatase A-like enzyme
MLCAFYGCTPTPLSPPHGAHLPGDGYSVAIILVDTLRPDHLGCYGYERARTPAIDSLASEGTLFENAYTASTFTGEAVASLFTGRPPAMNSTGLGWTARPTPQESNLPKLLESAGYKTGIFSSSFVMRFRGFYDSFQEAELFPGIEITTELEERVTDAALDFAKRHKGERTFQYIHYYAPHANYDPPAAYLEPFDIDRSIIDPSVGFHPTALTCQGMTADDPRVPELRKHYDGEIAFIDNTIGRYLDGMGELDLLSNTIIIFISDHGEEFLEHGGSGHAWNLYEETLRIPLIIRAPGLLKPQRIQEAVSISDVMPTLLRLLQQPHAPYESDVSGQYLFTAGDSAWNYAPRKAPIYASLFPESRAQLHAVLFENYKYIAGPRWLDAAECKQYWLLQGTMADRAKASNFLPLDPWAPSEQEVLFDLQTDPAELTNLIEKQPVFATQGRALMKDYEAASTLYRKKASPTTTTDPFDKAFVESGLQSLSEDAGQSGDSESSDGERISPDIIEGLETMGYL